MNTSRTSVNGLAVCDGCGGIGHGACICDIAPAAAPNAFARFPGGRIEHRLIPGTKTTVCGKDATTANRYPYLTRANSAVRDPHRPCPKCN